MCQPAALLFRADVDLHDARAHRRRGSNRKAAQKDLLRRSLRLAKPFRAGSHSLSDCSEPPSLGAGLPFYRLSIRCSREPLRFTSVLRLNPADCQPLSSSSFISQQQHIYASRELLFLGAVGCGKLKAATSPSSLVRAVNQCNRLGRKFSLIGRTLVFCERRQERSQCLSLIWAQITQPLRSAECIDDEVTNFIFAINVFQRMHKPSWKKGYQRLHLSESHNHPAGHGEGPSAPRSIFVPLMRHTDRSPRPSQDHRSRRSK